MCVYYTCHTCRVRIQMKLWAQPKVGLKYKLKSVLVIDIGSTVLKLWLLKDVPLYTPSPWYQWFGGSFSCQNLNSMDHTHTPHTHPPHTHTHTHTHTPPEEGEVLVLSHHPSVSHNRLERVAIHRPHLCAWVECVRVGKRMCEGVGRVPMCPCECVGVKGCVPM